MLFKNEKNRLIFIWLSILTILSLTTLFFCFYIVFNKEIIKESEFVPVMTIVITLAAITFSFSAINIYSVFNANIDNEKDRIDELFIKVNGNNVLNTDLESKILDIESKMKIIDKSLINIDSKIIWYSSNNEFKKMESLIILKNEFTALKSSADKNKFKQENLNDVLYYYESHKNKLKQDNPKMLQDIYDFLIDTGCIKKSK